MKYINTEKLKELIDEKWKELADKNVKVGGGKWDAEISTYLSVLRLINSLQQEQPEVDLEKEIKEEYLKHRCYGGRDNMLVILNEPQFNKIAKRFIELGLNTRKEEKQCQKK